MMAAIAVARHPRPKELTEDAILAEFAQVMQDWGHCRTAEGLRYPTVAEVEGRGCQCKSCRLSR